MSSPSQNGKAASAKAVSRQEERHRLVTEAVMAAGSVAIDDLARMFDVSVMTIHRDLDRLEAQNVLRKARGVATALPSSTVESNDAYRRAQQRDEKRDLAAAALAFIQPGQTVMLDDSTTVLPLLDMLATKAPLTVASNSLSVINGLVDAEEIELVGVGGEFRAWCNAFMGQMTLDAIAALHADVLLMSTSAVTGAACYHQNQDTISIKRALIAAAESSVLLVDHTKFERRALFRLCALADFDHVVVDAGTPSATVDALRQHHGSVTVAPHSS
ncbi:DeoR/GlpR family DNA-binding transcription regulator [Mycolicibacterium mengxianglii]|uniref:DeoR/GlpR family DNA-binding transcription regulator n=1 Tax=Mycolicibacterium mengxianglii TaxID=2736649 RepID=UPI0018EEE04C|nr:DeoR/GlpR family DNA-binding transcription regulator [Mycolicibacterium mengxianglii]